MWVAIIAFVVGMVAGMAVMFFAFREKPVGALRIDSSDPDDGPYMFLELSSDPRMVMRKKRIVLEVNTKSYLSQE